MGRMRNGLQMKRSQKGQTAVNTDEKAKQMLEDMRKSKPDQFEAVPLLQACVSHFDL